MQHAIRLGDAEYTVEAAEPVPGLRIYQHPTIPVGAGTYPIILGHHSGCALARFETRSDAEGAAHEIADYADWTRTVDDLRTAADVDGDAVMQRLVYFTPAVPIVQNQPAAA